jgi:hypothetical protein
MLAQVGGAKALHELPEQQSMQERVHARIGKAQARSPLAAGHDRTIDALEGILAEDAIVAQALDPLRADDGWLQSRWRAAWGD